MKERPGHIAETHPDLPRSLTLNHFWQSVMEGKWRPMSDTEISRLISDHYLARPPLTPITKTEKDTLTLHLTNYLKVHLNRQTQRLLCENPIVFFNNPAPDPEIEKLTWGFPLVFLAGNPAERAIALGATPLSPIQKIALFSNPVIWRNASLRWDDTSMPVISEGTRRFFSHKPLGQIAQMDTYGFTPTHFRQILEDLRKRVGKKPIQVLDIGGGNGLAMYELEQYFSHGVIVPTNLTLEEHPAFWPVSRQVLAPAEYMPEYFHEAFSLIVTNMATRNFTYPDIAIRNALYALAVGGFAKLDFFWDNNPLPRKELGRRSVALWDRLKDLNDKRFITFTPLQTGFDPRGIHYGSFTVVKAKSLEIHAETLG